MTSTRAVGSARGCTAGSLRWAEPGGGSRLVGSASACRAYTRQHGDTRTRSGRGDSNVSRHPIRGENRWASVEPVKSPAVGFGLSAHEVRTVRHRGIDGLSVVPR